VTEIERPDYSIVDRTGAGRFIFYPRRDHRPAPPGATDLLIEVAPDVSVGARFYAFERSWPTFLYFHGNGEVAADHDEVSELYRQAGANLFVADFRGYGRSTGFPSFQGLVEDAHPVARRFHEVLDEQGFDGRRLVMGRSLGTHPALELAANGERFRGLVVESGAAAIDRLLVMAGLDPSEGEAARLRAAHEAKVRSIALPVLIIHGEYDELIPLARAAELYDQLTGAASREMVVIPGAGHNDILWLGWQRYLEAIAGFVVHA
jgi:pimeloyl-ACP methyl ester carboxylesterase